MKYRVLSLCLLLLTVLSISAKSQFPQPQGWVNDFAGVMTEENKTELTAWLTELKEKTDVEMAIAIFPSLEGADYNDFATDLFRAWGVGNKQSEGILLLIAVQERKIKFEVGYAAEEYLTDVYTNQAFQSMISYLADGKDDYNSAVRQATLMILNRVAQTKGVSITGMPGYQFQKRATGREQKTGSLIIVAIFIFLIIVTKGRILYWLMLFSFLGGGGRGGFGGGSSGGFGSGGGFGGFGGFGGGRSGGGGAGGGF
jgi:uncharacterized protein